MASMMCELCGKGPAPGHGGVSVFRVNAPGQMPAIWRCRAHLGPTPVEEEVLDIVNIIEADRTRED